MTGLSPARSIGPYRLIRTLGAGASGVVHLAHDSRFQRDVALKLLHPGMASVPATRERFRRERRIVAQLDHPGIVRLLDGGEVDQTLFTVMEAVDGVTLAQAIAELRRRRRVGDSLTPGDLRDTGLHCPGHLPREALLDLVHGVVRAIAHAHGEGVLHRDIKPSNVLIDREGRPRVVDFGIAWAEGEAALTLPGGVLGSPGYCPPEQARGERCDARSDVFALGTLLHEVLSLQPPTDPERLPLRDPDLDWIVVKATAESPGARYADAAELDSELEALRRGDRLRFPAPGRLIRALKLLRRHRAAAAGVLAITAVLAAGLWRSTLHLQHARTARELARADFLTTEEVLARTSRMVQQREQSLARVSELAQRVEVEALLAKEASLHPRAPWLIDAFDRWLIDAETLRARVRPNVARALEQIVQILASQRQQGWITEAAPAPDWNRVEVLRAKELREWQEVARVLAEVEARIPEVRERRSWAGTITARSIDAHRAAWDRACREVRTNPAYRGLELSPQVGLVPLGPDPESGWWEFWDLATGEAPRRNPDTGRLIIDADAALVLVLLPSARFVAGADPPSKAIDPQLRPTWWEFDDLPHEVELPPCLVSKYEMTRGQWRRGTDLLPRDRNGTEDGLNPALDALPLEYIDWFTATRELTRLGLRLPSAEQWEYAARAGGRDPWYTGPDPRSLIGHENLSSTVWTMLGEESLRTALQWPDDGYRRRAPVGQFRPNGWGFHDVLGNVSEWTSRIQTLQEGLPGIPDESARCQRGGACAVAVLEANVSFRHLAMPSAAGAFTGLRPVRALDPSPAR